jgi:hypothetical protein
MQSIKRYADWRFVVGAVFGLSLAAMLPVVAAQRTDDAQRRAAGAEEGQAAEEDQAAEEGRPTEGMAEEGMADEQMEPSRPDEYYRILFRDGKHEVEQVAAEDFLESQEDEGGSVRVLESTTGTAQLVSECTTEGTRLSGARRSCDSHWSSVTAPPGFVFVKDSASIEWLGQNGSENRYDLQWDDWVEIIPGTGIQQPRTMRLKVHARSPSCRGCRGWSKVRVTGTYVNFQG